MIIAVDFDGTIVSHEFPAIGRESPGAFGWLKKWSDAGARLILWTMRSDGPGDDRRVLSDAVEFCETNGVKFWAVNCNPEQANWTTSPKVYANIYVDDAAYGVPLRDNPRMGGRPMVDWENVGPRILSILQKEKHV